MANSKFFKTAAVCGIGVAVSIIPAGLSIAHATTTKKAKTAHVTTTKKTKTAHATSTKKTKPAHVTTTKKTKTTVTKSGTFLGSSAMTAYGAVQVSITVKSGKITNVTSPVYPVGTYRDQQINAQAIPMLEQEVLQIQSSNIQGVGGASYTSEGFYVSLVQALAKAGLK